MRGYRLFPNNSSVAAEWRPLGFRVRTFHVLFTVVGLMIGGGIVAANLYVGLSVMFVIALLSGLFATYIYRTDPKLVLSEVTMLTLLFSGVRHRFRTNATVED